MLNHSFWKNRRVFITGHTGFKGSWLSLWLEALGAKAMGYSLDPPTEPSLFEQAEVARSIRSIRGDVRDFASLKSALTELRPEVIFHLAAQSVVLRGYEDPIETYSSNVMGTVHLLEAIRQSELRCVVVNVTSDKCYANREVVWGYREEEPMGGDDPYSSSKACSELVTTAFRESFFPPTALQHHGVALASARAGNVIGGGDWTKNQLVPDLVRAFLTGRPCLIRNDSAVRPWQFVLEPIRGYLMLAERLSEDGVSFASGWNFGPVNADAKPVRWIADILARLWGDGASWKHDDTTHPGEAHFLKLDASKAGAYLDWHPVLPLEQSLEWIVEWYRSFQSNADLRSVSLAQIRRYETLLDQKQPRHAHAGDSPDIPRTADIARSSVSRT
jgi:CDP-glucose 4,6-dehydratase